MGIPSFALWLFKKWGSVSKPVPQRNDEPLSAPNPFMVEMDSLFVDANGLVHPAFHPEPGSGIATPETEEQVFSNMFMLMDQAMKLVRPRALLYIAIDGVAPRAKMNQQRARRFKAAQEAREAREAKEAAAGGAPVAKVLDSNTITPGTEFMERLSLALEWWVHDRQSRDPAWKSLKVILSDASVPGEGEHKIVDFLRKQKFQEGYLPNQRHVVYGLDADLILLGLATHEPNFYVLREDVVALMKNKCRACGQTGHMARECLGAEKIPEAVLDKLTDGAAPNPSGANKPFIYVDLAVMRHRLEDTFAPVSRNLGDLYDLERCIDDFILMCSYVGNDFLPHLPSLAIREGSLDFLIGTYCSNIHLFPDYLTTDGRVNIPCLLELMKLVGVKEDQTFQTRRNRELQDQARDADRKAHAAKDPHARGHKAAAAAADRPAGLAGRHKREQRHEDAVFNNGEDVDMAGARGMLGGRKRKHDAEEESAPTIARQGYLEPMAGPPPAMQDKPKKPKEAAAAAAAPFNPFAPLGEADSADKEEANRKAAAAIRRSLLDQTDGGPGGDEGGAVDIIDAEDADADGDGAAAAATQKAGPVDKVKLWEAGWKERYYRDKFKVDLTDEEFRRDLCYKWLEGVCWAFEYYYRGVQSWTWFYPHHYAPFASDFALLDPAKTKVSFEMGVPFKPFSQLMGVLPADSGAALPPAYRRLMTAQDSPIVDFYPTEFELDFNGQQQAWKAIVLLPFIDEGRLLDAIADVEPTLTEAERKRNEFGENLVYCHIDEPLAQPIGALYKLPISYTRATTINAAKYGGFSGKILAHPKYAPTYAPNFLVEVAKVSPAVFRSFAVGTNKTIFAVHRNPDLPEGWVPKKHPGAIDAPREERSYDQQRGGGGGGGGGYGGGGGGYHGNQRYPNQHPNQYQQRNQHHHQHQQYHQPQPPPTYYPAMPALLAQPLPFYPAQGYYQAPPPQGYPAGGQGFYQAYNLQSQQQQQQQQQQPHHNQQRHPNQHQPRRN